MMRKHYWSLVRLLWMPQRNLTWANRRDEAATLPDAETIGRWRAELANPDKFTLGEYYAFLREEISREDTILNQRLTWTMAFQGFLFAAVGTLVSGLWASPHGFTLKVVLCLLIGLVGLALSLMSVSGVDTATKSLHDIKNAWSRIEDQVGAASQVPQAFGQHSESLPFAEMIPRVFALAWIVFLFGALAVMVISPRPAPPHEWRMSITISGD